MSNDCALSKRTPSKLLKLTFNGSTWIAFKLGQALNASVPMLVTLFGMVTLVRPQFANALSPMLVTLLGMVTLFRREQSANASSPMLLTLLGMVALVRAE